MGVQCGVIRDGHGVFGDDYGISAYGQGLGDAVGRFGNCNRGVQANGLKLPSGLSCQVAFPAN